MPDSDPWSNKKLPVLVVLLLVTTENKTVPFTSLWCVVRNFLLHSSKKLGRKNVEIVIKCGIFLWFTVEVFCFAEMPQEGLKNHLMWVSSSLQRLTEEEEEEEESDSRNIRWERETCQRKSTHVYLLPAPCWTGVQYGVLISISCHWDGG